MFRFGPDKPDKKDNELNEIPVVDTVIRDTQQITRGSRKKFSENLAYNLSQFRERLPLGQLSFEEYRVGTLSQRRVVIIYLKNIINPGIVDEIRDRMESIKAETVLDGSYIERNLENSGLSPFPQVETTTRPDVAESALAQGRAAVVVDGCPQVLLVPATFFDLMDTPEDAYSRWFFAASFFRVARYIMFLLAVFLPGFYIAVTSFNPELIPTALTLLIAGNREATPFPVYFEAFAMMGVMEAVRMMMIRLPTQVGATIALFAGVTLVGAGIAGHIIGIPITMIVTLSLISSFGISNYDLRLAVRILQFFTMIMASVLGLFGLGISFLYIAVHLAALKSFGIPYMAPLAPLEASGWGHTVLRENTVVMPQDETYKPQPTKK